MAEPVFIWVRSSLDWARGEAVRPEFQPRVDLWNATFNIPFHAFRHRIREIARLNHSRVDGALAAGWEEIPERSLVLPVDDDDWFSPDAARALARAFDPRAAGYLWPSTWVEVPRSLGHRAYLTKRRLLPWTRPKWICTTNNYAMVKTGDAKPLLESHTKASRCFENWLDAPTERNVRRIDRRLSIANRTLASQTTLRFADASMSRSQLVRKFRRYRRLYERSFGGELEWCRPYVRMMSLLMGELEIRHAADRASGDSAGSPSM